MWNDVGRRLAPNPLWVHNMVEGFIVCKSRMLLQVMCRHIFSSGEPKWREKECNTIDLELYRLIPHREIPRAISGESHTDILCGLGARCEEKTAKAIKSHQGILQIANIEVSYNSFSNKLKSYPFDVFWQEMYIYCLKWLQLLSSEPQYIIND